jgi:hypothetical protein
MCFGFSDWLDVERMSCWSAISRKSQQLSAIPSVTYDTLRDSQQAPMRNCALEMTVDSSEKMVHRGFIGTRERAQLTCRIWHRTGH